MKIATVIVGTTSYIEPMKVCLRRVYSALSHAGHLDGPVIVVTDKASEKTVRSLLKPFGGNGQVLALDVTEDGKKYKEERQLMIARLQTAGFEAARNSGADLLWSVEGDVLVPYNALTCSLQMLAFDDGYYDVAFVTYPSHGGGSFLGGHGSYQHPIEEDFLPEERQVPWKLERAIKACEERLQKPENREKEMPRIERLRERLKACPPKGNVFELNAKKWRRRGWLGNSHPGIGRGAVIESDWTGLGCTLMSRKAMNLAHFDGYEGKGTQDLYLNWHRWKPAGLRFCCITHTVCEHVVRNNDGKLIHYFAHHEQVGEMQGHLRFQPREFNPLG